LYYSYDNDFQQSIDNYQKAVALYRGMLLPVIFTQISYAYLSAGFIEEAKNFCMKAFQLNGDTLEYYFLLSDIEQASGNYENSIKYLSNSYAIDTSNINVLFGLGADYLYLRQQKEALKYFKKCIDKNISLQETTFKSGYYNSFGWAYLQKGDKEKAEFYFAKVIASISKQTVLRRTPKFQSEKYMDLAMVYAQKGDKKAAFKYLGLYNQLQKIGLWDTHIRNDPRFDNIKNEPEFQQITNDLEAKYQAEHNRVKKWLEEQGMLN
jgi:tetratricopeptide (TPR) repeat protein